MGTPELTVYVDGTCGFCVAEVNMLKRHDRLGALAFVDLATPGFADFPPGTDLATLNARLHSVTADGRVLTGLDSMQAIYRQVGLGWVVWPLRIRPLRPLMAWCYEQFARHRYRVSNFFGMRVTPATPRCDGTTCHAGSPFTKGLRDE